MCPHWIGEQRKGQTDDEAGTGLGEIEGKEHGEYSVKASGVLGLTYFAEIASTVSAGHNYAWRRVDTAGGQVFQPT